MNQEIGGTARHIRNDRGNRDRNLGMIKDYEKRSIYVIFIPVCDIRGPRCLDSQYEVIALRPSLHLCTRLCSIYLERESRIFTYKKS